MSECINVAYSGSAKVNFHAFPEITLMTQAFQLPGVSALYPSLQGPIARTPLSATGIEYEKLSVTFLIGENFSAYRKIIEWLQNKRTELHSATFSDATITLLTTSKQPFQDIVFRDIMPINISPVPFDVTLPEPQPLRATATFDYTDYSFI